MANDHRNWRLSPHADSIGTFDSGAVELAIIVGMVLGGTNTPCTGGQSQATALRTGAIEFRTYLNS